MVRLFPTEQFIEIKIKDKLQLKYAISNFGRLISYIDKFTEGNLIKGSLTNGYRIWRYKVNTGTKIRHKHLFFYKLVAEYHIENDDIQNKKNVIHVDHNLGNDYFKNLKWVDYQEKKEHTKTNPRVIAGYEKKRKYRKVEMAIS